MDKDEFILFYYSLLRRPELDEIFIKTICKKKHDGDSCVYPNLKDVETLRMTAENLADFLATEQKVEMAVEECEKFIQHFEPTADKTTLSLEGEV